MNCCLQAFNRYRICRMFSECGGSPKKSVRERLEATQAAVQRLGYLEEDRHVLPGLRIRAAGLHKLVQLAIETFGEYNITANN